MAERLHIPSLVGRHFNVIMNEKEKFGGLPVTQMETSEFAQCVSNCALTKLPFSGSVYTWWNRRTGEDNIFKRLDRFLGNELFW